ncbi:MAG: corrinoid protein [Candidatus Neomarinimicrobiota bacterium]
MELLQQLAQALEKGDHQKTGNLTGQAIAQKIPPKQILDEGLLAGMQVVGDRFAVRDIFLPEVLLAARAMYAGLDLLKPLLLASDIPTLGKVVIGTVNGDMHDLGKNLVSIMLKGAGFEVIDLGKDVPAAKFVETAQQEQAAVIGMSALLTTTMTVMKDVVDLLKEKGLDGSVKTIVGGAPVTDEWAREIGADAYAYDASKAVESIKALVG